MWMVNPKVMCDHHLLGEHVDLHMIVASIQKEFLGSVRALARIGLIDTVQVTSRHREIVAEMAARGMNHHTPINWMDVDGVGHGTVDPVQSAWELYRRCGACRKLIDQHSKEASA
jgi:hypothetical protein